MKHCAGTRDLLHFRHGESFRQRRRCLAVLPDGLLGTGIPADMGDFVLPFGLRTASLLKFN